MNDYNSLISYYPFLTGLKRQGGIRCREGWYNIIARLCDGLSSLNLDSDFTIIQIKSKFGGLTVHTSCCSDKKVFDLIRNAEQEALHTCEICASTDSSVKTARFRPWYVETLCDKCVSKSIAEWMASRTGLTVVEDTNPSTVVKVFNKKEFIKSFSSWEELIQFIFRSHKEEPSCLQYKFDNEELEELLNFETKEFE